MRRVIAEAKVDTWPVMFKYFERYVANPLRRNSWF